MKSTLIRMLTIMALATSISAFAGTEKEKAHSGNTGNTNCNSGNTESNSAPSSRPAGKTDGNAEQSDQDQEKSRKQMQIEQQDQQWLHDLMGIYGG